MQNNFTEDAPNPDKNAEQNSASAAAPRSNFFTRGMTRLAQMGLGESLLRLGTNLFSMIAIGIVILLVQIFYRQPNPLPEESAAATPAAAPVVAEMNPPAQQNPIAGIPRAAQLHTNIPSRPRQEILQYTVLDGDTVFGIAEKFGLEPQTILWGNTNTLYDDPHSLKAGQVLNILPVNGVYWEWLGGIAFGDWAKFYGVSAESIIELPVNNLDPKAVGDYENANIPSGTWLVIPGGKREFSSWGAPLGVTRENPASARVLGPGACDPISGGAIGYGTFVFPTNKHYLSGFDYSPKANHYGIDLAGAEGEGVYASDAGVIVYSGWNNYGYGNMIMVDHGNGFQTLYAHLSALYRGCGQSVGQGEGVGAVGSTGRSSGPHLHFEIMGGIKLNPWDYLPAP
jgi:murein DD-endopeptidase MepM/ murein hydrolase activator NlpD